MNDYLDYQFETKQQNEKDQYIHLAPEFCQGPCHYLDIQNNYGTIEPICTLEDNTPPDNKIECRLEIEKV
jgi:hypothetical protein